MEGSGAGTSLTVLPFTRRNPPPGISVATNGITLPAAAPGQTLTLNPQGVTFAATPDSPSMTVRLWKWSTCFTAPSPIMTCKQALRLHGVTGDGAYSVQIGNAGVQYNNPVVDSIPAQQADSLFPGEGVRAPT